MPISSVRALDDLAGDKLLALFGRAAPRDFVDVHALRDRFTRRTLESLAAAKDLGFNLAVTDVPLTPRRDNSVTTGAI